MTIEFGLQRKQLDAFKSTATEILFGGAAGGGKAMPIEEVVVTPFGYRKNKDLKVGDAISNPDGTVAKIIQIHQTVKRDLYRITFSDGSYCENNIEHLWNAWRSGKVKKKNNKKVFGEDSAQVVTTKTLLDWVEVAKGQKKLGKRPNWPLIPVTKEVTFNKQSRWAKVDICPYMLGLLLGGGHLGDKQISLTSNDDEIINSFAIEFVNVDIREKQNPTTKDICVRGNALIDLREKLTSHNLLGKKSHNKFIPDCYKFASIEQRYAIIQGIMDSDGTCDSRGHVSFTSTSERLADDVREVLLSLGAMVTKTSKSTFYRNADGVKVECRDAYVLYIKHRDPRKLFRLKRKKKLAEKGINPNMCRRVVNVEKVASNVPMRCITVSNPNGLYLQGKDYVVTHNSFLMRVASIVWCLEIEKLQVYLFRKNYTDLWKNHMEGEGGYLSMLAPLVDAGLCTINTSTNQIRFTPTGSVIHLCHCQHEKDVYKYQGAEIHVLLIDELTHFTDTVYRFLRNRMRLGGTKIPERYKGLFPKAINSANPGGPGHMWVKATFVDPANEMEIWQTPPEEGGMLRQYIPAKLSDNKVLLENDPTYAEKLKGLGDPEMVRAMLEGDWNIAQGAYFAHLWSNDVIIPWFDMSKSSYYIDRAYDWGSSKPGAVGWFAESDGTEIELKNGETFWCPKGSIIQICEYYSWNGKPNEGNKELSKETARKIRDIEEGFGFKVNPGPADNMIFDVRDGISIADEMATLGIRWERSDKSPGSRVNGWIRMADMLDAAKKRDPERPWLLFMDNCRHSIRTIPTIPRDDKKPEDIDTESEDHIADMIRYRITKKRKTMIVTKMRGI